MTAIHSYSSFRTGDYKHIYPLTILSSHQATVKTQIASIDTRLLASSNSLAGYHPENG